LQNEFSFFKTYSRKCPDGTKHEIYRDINEVLPLYLTDKNGGISVNADVIQTITAGIDANYVKKISGLLIDLDESNRSLMFFFRAVYLVYKSKPCKNSDYFTANTTKIMNDHLKLKALDTRIKGLINLANSCEEKNFSELYKSIIQDFGEFLPNEASRAKISYMRSAAQEWKNQDQN